MVLKVFVALIVIIGVLVGASALILPRDQIVHLIVFRDFFDVSLPILAFGALIKYLCCCTRSKNKCCDNKNKCCDKNQCEK